MPFIIDPSLNIHMWVVILLTFLAFFLFARERWPLELSAIVILVILLIFGYVFPYLGPFGNNLLDAHALLSGFANSSLLAVMALLVMGQAVVQTSAMTPITRMFLRMRKGAALFGLFMILISMAVISGFMNNTPLVIIAIPVMQELASRLGLSSSRVMLPLSFAAILGGMMTLVGSSTNMLVSSAMEDLGYQTLDFFEFTVPGSILAAVGMIYVLFILPRLLGDRMTMARELVSDDKQFIAEINVTSDSKLNGLKAVDGVFLGPMEDVSLRLVHRNRQLILPPFENYEVMAGDILIIAAARETLTQFMAKHSGFLIADAQGLDDPQDEDDTIAQKEPHILAEVMIPPASRLIDVSLDHLGFEENYDCQVLGIERRARVVRRRLGQIRLEAGDVLLVLGQLTSVNNLRAMPELILLSGSKKDVPAMAKAPLAGLIFLITIVLAAWGVLSIPVAAIAGAAAMVLSGCINLRQAGRAMDRKIYFLVAAALALGTALQATGGAVFLADSLLSLSMMHDPFIAAISLFFIVAVATNMLTNNACAVLFTPIAINLALQIGADPRIFALTVLFAANCSFASPIGYQTNLLVMGPGHYRFHDFFKAGIPLAIIIWITYCFLAKYYYGL